MGESTRRAPGEGSVYETENNGKRRWVASYGYRDDATGKRRFVRGIGSTRAEAVRRREANWAKHLAKGAAEPIKEPSRTLETALDGWLATRSPDQLGAESRRKYRRDLEHHVFPAIGGKPLEAITEEELQTLFNITLTSIGPSARWHAYTELATVLTWAVSKGFISESPLANVPKPKRSTAIAEEDGRWVTERTEQVIGMLQWLAEPDNPHHQHFPMVLCGLLGLRRAELLGLTWERINQLDNAVRATVIITQQLARHEKGSGKSGWYIKSQTKTKAHRSIPLPPEWQKALIQQRAKALGERATEPWQKDLVFLREDASGKTTHFTFNAYYAVWDSIQADYANRHRKVPEPLTPGEKWRGHFNRHLAANLLAISGVPESVIQSILGWNSTAMLAVYRHISRAEKKEATSAMGKGIFG